jgi:AraC family transcriptional regulator of adaptative response/methylated-DNA-[protein]-cysteine methyltransferase
LAIIYRYFRKIRVGGTPKSYQICTDYCISGMEQHVDYQRVEKAIRYLLENYQKQPSLDEVAAHIHISPFHFHRLFTEWAGISPKKFLQYITLDQLKKEILLSDNLVDAAERVGLSAQSRVYDLFVHIEAVTPQEYKKQGRGVEINCGIHSSPFGRCLIANTSRGICSMSFITGSDNEAIEALKEQWPLARLIRDQENTEALIRNIFNVPNPGHQYTILARGTRFQLKVWEALLRIPFGAVTSYQHIAKIVGKSGATRAVASAIARNPVAYLIPCHRVIRSEGIIGNYHWNPYRKAAIIGWEKARATNN